METKSRAWLLMIRVATEYGFDENHETCKALDLICKNDNQGDARKDRPIIETAQMLAETKMSLTRGDEYELWSICNDILDALWFGYDVDLDRYIRDIWPEYSELIVTEGMEEA